MPKESERELLVVIPVYNEEASIRQVVVEWNAELLQHTPDFLLLVINDGSTDGTHRVLDALQPEIGPRLQVINRANRGHGQTCLQGYGLAVEQNYRYVFQVDSDGQCDPQYFSKLWAQREHFDVIYGKRVRRDDGWCRSVASWVLTIVVLVRSRTLCADANVPYRLMHTNILPTVLPLVPADFFLANVALAVLLKRAGNLRHGCVPIGFRKRYGGQPTVRLPQFGGRARQLVKQLGQLDQPATNPDVKKPTRSTR